MEVQQQFRRFPARMLAVILALVAVVAFGASAGYQLKAHGFPATGATTTRTTATAPTHPVRVQEPDAVDRNNQGGQGPAGAQGAQTGSTAVSDPALEAGRAADSERLAVQARSTGNSDKLAPACRRHGGPTC
jgi:hypothetical protein